MRRRQFLWDWFQPTAAGLENLDGLGGALLVSNHGVFGLDLTVLIQTVFRQTGRPLRTLGDHVVFSTPGFRDAAWRIGAVEGTPDNADWLLQNGHLVLVYPGGANEALAPESRKHQLMWNAADGFVKTAIRNQVPIVPVAGLGVDDTYRQVLDRRQVGRTPLGWLIRRLFGEKYILPIYAGLGPLPRRVRIHYEFGAPIEMPGNPASAGDPGIVEQFRNQVQSVLQGMLDAGMLARRQH